MRDMGWNWPMPDQKIKTVLYAANVTQLEDEKLYAAAFDAVSERRREKTARYRFKKDRNLSLGAEPMSDWTVYHITGDTLNKLAK